MEAIFHFELFSLCRGRLTTKSSYFQVRCFCFRLRRGCVIRDEICDIWEINGSKQKNYISKILEENEIDIEPETLLQIQNGGHNHI